MPNIGGGGAAKRDEREPNPTEGANVFLYVATRKAANGKRVVKRKRKNKKSERLGKIIRMKGGGGWDLWDTREHCLASHSTLAASNWKIRQTKFQVQ